MNIIKGFRDMGAMLNAAPGLIESANEMSAQAKAMQAPAAGSSAGAYGFGAPVQIEPNPANLVPIAGVDIELWARIAKGIAPYGYDVSKLPAVAASFGVAPADWAVAVEGWNTRLAADPGVAQRFNAIYRAA
ncbi:hypothetical protein SAMN06295879_1169 [Agreia bicolorata]|uniref:Uncharacterized protein n=1 Tax=Agreia bicolorata TaxID=110935 RepID=A0A1T4XIG6_9MICO|nr:hypothetical protein [Agreia bicolorata]SKA89276.1 hypothetical protein SAMN06295879_1169 [Agreia bicolorata]